MTGDVFTFLGALLGSGGVGGMMIKYMLNGSREGIRRIEARVNEELPAIREHMHTLDVKVARIEGKLEVIDKGEV